MNDIKDGGPAFPVAYEHAEVTSEQHGMSLRDYFAAKALPAYFSDGESHGQFDGAASWAYQMADAMLKARSA